VVDFHHPSKLMVLWGSNVTSTNEEGEIGSLLLGQVKNGTELIVIDPRKTELAKRAAVWLQLRPGTDSALGLAFLHVIVQEGLYDRDFVESWTYGFDELARAVQPYTPEAMSEVTWVPSEQIRKAARLYATSRPAGISWGNPIEHNIHTFDTVRALVCLMALCGNLDVPGGNIQANEPDIMGLGEFVRADRIPSKRKEMIHAHHHTIPKLMTVPPAFFRQAVLEENPYPVKAAYMQCTNPLLTYADSRRTHDALLKLDFLAVAGIFMTPTAALADVVLPAATQFEFNDIGHYGIGHGYILARPKVVDPPKECWPDMKILNELGKALTPREYWPEDYESFLESVLSSAGLTYEQFAAQGYLKGNVRFRKYESKGFKTPTGKVELVLSQAEKYGLAPLPRFAGLPTPEDPAYPLVLTSAKSPYYLHSSYRWVKSLRERSPVPAVEMHPDTGIALGISNGDEVVVETKWGDMVQVAQFNEGLHRQVICASHGWWFPELGPGCQYEWKKANFNMLTTARELGKEFGTPNLKGMGCRVRKA
jgi:anaerobic selenocysteine-containing dehydrogenase